MFFFSPAIGSQRRRSPSAVANEIFEPHLGSHILQVSVIIHISFIVHLRVLIHIQLTMPEHPHYQQKTFIKPAIYSEVCLVTDSHESKVLKFSFRIIVTLRNIWIRNKYIIQTLDISAILSLDLVS